MKDQSWWPGSLVYHKKLTEIMTPYLEEVQKSWREHLNPILFSICYGKELKMTRYCPNCKVDLRGDPIPEEYRESYSKEDPYYYRTIGIYDRDRDMTVEWRCPDCKHVWPRKGL